MLFRSERLLGDAMDGDATLFARQDAVEAAWGIVDPIIKLDREPHLYTGGTWGPQQAEELTRSRGGWVDPA